MSSNSSSNGPSNGSGTKKPANRGLGRGLSSLLGDSGIAQATSLSGNVSQSGNVSSNIPGKNEHNVADMGTSAVVMNNANAEIISGLQEIPVEWINVGPWQPRRRFDKEGLEELAASIREKGIVQPILVRPDPKNNKRYQIVAGERRWRAAQLAKIHQVPAIIRQLSDTECYEIALIENIQRRDLSVIEEAQGYQKLLKTTKYKQDQLAEIIGKSRSHIANLLRLLSLPDPVQTMLLDQKLTMGQARPLIGHPQATMLAKTIAAKGFSARQAEMLAKKDVSATGARGKSTPNKNIDKSADIKALEKAATAKLGLALNIDWDEAKERGKVTVQCGSLDQMTDFLAQLGIK